MLANSCSMPDKGCAGWLPAQRRKAERGKMQPQYRTSTPAPNCTLEEVKYKGKRTVATLTGPNGRFFWNRSTGLWGRKGQICGYEHALKLVQL